MDKVRLAIGGVVALAFLSGYQSLLFASSGSEPIAKVVRKYALTSANDFPQRDPQDWRLLGSNDNGTNWTVLDIRKGELFSNRHERKIYTTNNKRAFHLYRFQIDRIRDPAAADSVQIAELEPLGDAEDDLDPAPFFDDKITSQGENPPWETRFHAFDGRIETKWLDRAARNPETRASWIQWEYANQASIVITNLGRLHSLRSRAAKGYAVRIEGVIVGWLRGANIVCLLDATGSLQIPAAWNSRELPPGQSVLLEAVSGWTNQTVNVKECRISKRGAIPPEKARTLALGQQMTRGEDWQWVEAEGKVEFCTWPDGQLAFELKGADQTLLVQVLHVDPGEKPRLSGARVRVQGLCEGVLNVSGDYVAGRLWVPDLAAITVLDPLQNQSFQTDNLPANSPRARVLNSIAEIGRLSPEQLMRRPQAKVRGVTTEVFGAYMQEGSAAVELWYVSETSSQLPEFGSLIEVKGKAGWAPGHGPIVRVESFETLGRAMLPNPEPCSWGQLATGKMVDKWVEIEGVVRSTDGSHLLLSCEGGQLMATIRSGSALQVKQLVDATVRIRGVNVAATDSRGRVQGIQLLVPSLEQVEVRQPAPEPFSLATQSIGSLLQVSGSRNLLHRVKIEGVLTLQDGRNYFLQDSTNSAMAIARQKVVLTFPSGGQNWFFGQATPEDDPLNQYPKFEPGDRLEVVGFPETRGFSPILTEVIVRKIGTAPLVQPLSARVEEIARGSLDSSLVSLEAVVLRTDASTPNSIVELQSGQNIFQALLPSASKPGWTLPAGSRVRVKGVCQVEPAPYSELGQRVASFKLLVGSLADLAVLDRPPWWTLPRALAAAAALVVVLAMALAWIGILRQQVEDRTKQLKQEVAEHEKTELLLADETSRVHAEIEQRKRIEAEVERGHRELLRTSRLAGMAEVATSVLHNVGNVLNGVNVLAGSIEDQIQRSKASSVKSIAGLLAEHRDDIGSFMTEDSRGRQLPGYVERLGNHLSAEQSKLLEKTKALNESIQHIKEIVAMQQNYAKVSGHRETMKLSEILEDALRMHSGALERDHINVIRDFEDTPAIMIDRHKVLQILFNLLENANYACNSSGQTKKEIVVRIRQVEDRLQIRVIDNGIGIPPENLTRIFAQEFSTRKNGHGFGLHSSILAAQDMGGTLLAQSEGAGKGATFILELPLQPDANPDTEPA